MILKQNLDVLVPKYIGTISFVFFLEQIQRADWGAIDFGSAEWTQSATAEPDSLKRGFATFQAQIFHLNASNKKWIHFGEKNRG